MLPENRIFPTGESARAPGARRLKVPVEFVVDPQKKLVVARFRGKVVAADIQQYVKRLLAHPSFLPDFSEIVDLTEVEELDLQANDMLRLADQVDPFSNESRRAFVVRTAVQHHAARMHKALRNKESIAIFHGFEDAERWIAG